MHEALSSAEFLSRSRGAASLRAELPASPSSSVAEPTLSIEILPTFICTGSLNMRLKNASTIFMTFLAAFCIQLDASSKLHLADDGYYNDLLVFVQIPADGNVQEKYYAHLLHVLQTALREASDILEKLTHTVGRRLGFGEVSVLLPHSLGEKLAELNNSRLQLYPATWQQPENADFVVSPDIKESDEGVLNKSICGVQAKIVKLSTKSLEASIVYRPVARTMALYFSQFRWGLFSEAPLGDPIQKNKDPFNRVLPRLASCNPDLQVKAEVASGNQTGRSCKFGEPNCKIVVTEPAYSNVASFLFAPYSAGVTRFCDADFKVSDPRHRHNKDAENLHNKYCHRRSAAEVIRDHEDFLRPINSATTMNSNFNVRLVVEPKRRRVVIVMDISGSMDTDNRLKSLIGAVNHYIAYTLETGSECALISFDHNATVLQNFILVDSPAVRRQLMQSVSNLTTKGWTCIGKAVQEAMKLLGEDPTSPTNRSSGQILLVSDGEENKECSIDLDATIDAIAKTSLRAHTIRFGDLADTRMSILSERTNGHAQLSPVVSDLAASKLILQMTSLQSDLAGVNSIVVLDSRQVPSDLRYPVEFDIGPRSNLVFSLFLPSDPAKVGSLRLMLRSPSGRTFNCSGGSSTVCTVDVAVGSVTMQIPDAEVEYRMYAVVEAGNTEVARFDIFEQHGNEGVYTAQIPLNAVHKARQYAVTVFVTHPSRMQLSAGTLTVQEEDPNFDKHRVVPEKITGTYISRREYASKIIEIKWNPVEDPSGLLPPKAEVPVYSLRYEESGDNCTDVNSYYSCPELAVTNQSSVNIYSQYMALNEPPMWIAVIAISAANVPSLSRSLLYIQDKKPLAAEDEKRLGLLPSTVTKSSQRTKTSMPWYGGHGTKASMSAARSSTMTMLSRPYKFPHLHLNAPKIFSNDSNKAKSTTKFTANSMANSTTKSSAQLNVDLAWLNAGTVCSLAVLTVSAQQWLIQ
uniref:VWFA domain-containing protein n=1 Tax=Macrostomum lignano TaxID=282301 RepID=A0A1I8J6R9_9PLAT